jgi:transmembrane sensor
MDRSELQRLAEKYLNGTGTAEEMQLLHQWYDTIHENEQSEIVDSEASKAETKQRIFENIHSGISKDTIETAPKGRRQAIVKTIVRITSAAAVILIAAGLWLQVNKGGGKSLTKGATGLVNVMVKKVTKITLPDGSEVWLNANTVFKYPRKFTGKLREVELIDGRAFFDVKHEVDHPFVVKTESLNITVLGTSFDVRTYAKEGTTKVSVVTGKVGITRPGHTDEPAVMLLPKEQIILSVVTSQLKKETVQDPVVNLWCKSPLVFDQENLDNVFKALEKQYNTHIQVADKRLLTERISITLNNQRLDTIMEILSFTKHFNYQMANDSTVVIK